MLIVRDVAQQPHTASATDERSYTSIRKRFVVADGSWVLRQMFAEIAVGYKESRSNSGQRNKPLRIGEPELRGARPDFPLVHNKIGCQSRDTMVLRWRELLWLGGIRARRFFGLLL